MLAVDFTVCARVKEEILFKLLATDYRFFLDVWNLLEPRCQTSVRLVKEGI